MTQSIELKHDDKATEWALSADRVPVFSVVRPNPDHAAWLERKAACEAQPTDDGGIRDPFGEPEPAVELRTQYSMPSKPNAGLALAYLKRARENADMAASWLLEAALGSEGYDAFTDELAREDDPEVALATMRNVVTFVAQRALGGLSGKA